MVEDLSWSLQPKRSSILFLQESLANNSFYSFENEKKITKRNRKVLVVGSWNVRTLVECFGDVRVCQKRQVIEERSEVINRKLDFLVGELKRYGVSVAGVQESRWFGRDVWSATGGSTFLHSGRPLQIVVIRQQEMRVWGFFWMRSLRQHGGRVVKCGRRSVLGL